MRFGTELVDFEQDDEGVTARLRNLESGAEEKVRATYLIVADGTAGGTRRALGINRHGPGVLQHF